jgi:hypothetical protein
MDFLRIMVLALIAAAIAGVLSGFISGDVSRGIPTAVGTAIGTGIAFAWLFSRTTKDVPGLTLGDAEAKIADRNLMKGFRRSHDGGKAVYTTGSGILASHVALEPQGSGVRLGGMRSVVGRLAKGLMK